MRCNKYEIDKDTNKKVDMLLINKHPMQCAVIITSKTKLRLIAKWNRDYIWKSKLRFPL